MPRSPTPPELDPITLARLRALIAELGEHRVRQALCVPRSTLARAAAGFPVRWATAEVIRLRMEALELDAPSGGGTP